MRSGPETNDVLSIRLADSLTDMHRLLRVADAVWGPPAGAMVSPDFLMALAHTGGYVALAEIHDAATDSSIPVGASFGFLARCGTEIGLHSHITGVIPSRQHLGIGRRLKHHQRTWALGQGLDVITWTFDPLVRRNGWFNLHGLGATAEEFHIDFYGPLGDTINGADETDRLLARWDLRSTRACEAEKEPIPPPSPGAEDVLVPTPDDIVTLRRTDPEAARVWRRGMRDALVTTMTTHRIIGMTDQGSYVLVARVDDEVVGDRHVDNGRADGRSARRGHNGSSS